MVNVKGVSGEDEDDEWEDMAVRELSCINRGCTSFVLEKK